MNGHTITVEVADTTVSRARGLSYRQTLAPDHGMIFFFDTPRQQSFWMKGMQFPIDIIFIRDHRVVFVASRVPVPDGTSVPTISPSEPADTVLEVPAGSADAWGVRVGMAISE
jgi:uncharacterized membrane protein (UPF0127 family)